MLHRMSLAPSSCRLALPSDPLEDLFTQLECLQGIQVRRSGDLVSVSNPGQGVKHKAIQID